jgi:NADH:ubiquinone oxidoreductase, Na(+)-translocating, C subunit
MDRNSNKYTIIYASVMVVLVALVLAFTSQTLKSKQAENEATDKMSQILRSININSSAQDAQSKFKELITDSYLVNIQGDKTEGNAFDAELSKELLKPESERTYPVFEASVDGKKKYILAMSGAGLWGPLWGYISLDEDKNTVYGADFGHAGETPGLGAEISQSFFGHSFTGKQFFKDGQFVSIAIVKPGKSEAGRDYVDGISGGTITSQGVDAMLYSSIKAYAAFLTKKNN